ncbi:MAG: hypothetical protein K2Y16_06770 [Burkholderiales bacterium]|nr:hypothetical protein [Burkholderiales bacterium]
MKLDEAAAALARAIENDAQAIAKRKDIPEARHSRCTATHGAHERLCGTQRRFLDAFFFPLFKFEKASHLIPEGGFLERLKCAQAAYFSSVATGDCGPDSLLRRPRMGALLIGLELKWQSFESREKREGDGFV